MPKLLKKAEKHSKAIRAATTGTDGKNSDGTGDSDKRRRKNHNDRHEDGRRDGREHDGSQERWDPYASLLTLGDLPRGVIQATGDRYTTAAEARRLMGADSAVSTLYAVPARNHRFDDGMPAFRESLKAALDRIAGVAPVVPAPRPDADGADARSAGAPLLLR